ncbi:MAG: hypothetical protein U0163_13950 [Gemmatimonadaceae bacterium]
MSPDGLVKVVDHRTALERTIIRSEPFVVDGSLPVVWTDDTLRLGDAFNQRGEDHVPLVQESDE